MNDVKILCGAYGYVENQINKLSKEGYKPLFETFKKNSSELDCTIIMIKK
jgi:hypothetical protein